MKRLLLSLVLLVVFVAISFTTTSCQAKTALGQPDKKPAGKKMRVDIPETQGVWFINFGTGEWKRIDSFENTNWGSHIMPIVWSNHSNSFYKESGLDKLYPVQDCTEVNAQPKVKLKGSVVRVGYRLTPSDRQDPSGVGGFSTFMGDGLITGLKENISKEGTCELVTCGRWASSPVDKSKYEAGYIYYEIPVPESPSNEYHLYIGDTIFTCAKL